MPLVRFAVAGIAVVAVAIAWVYVPRPHTPTLSFAPVPESGAEDADLWALYGSFGTPARNAFYTAAVTLNADPRVAMLGAHVFGREEFETAFYGADEVAAKSPFSWHLLALAPGVLAARYVSAFLDTNPLLGGLMVVNLVLRDALFFADAALTWRSGARGE